MILIFSILAVATIIAFILALYSDDKSENCFCVLIVSTITWLLAGIVFYNINSETKCESFYHIVVVKPTKNDFFGNFKTFEECQQALENIKTEQNNVVQTYTASDEEEHYVNSYTFFCSAQQYCKSVFGNQNDSRTNP